MDGNTEQVIEEKPFKTKRMKILLNLGSERMTEEESVYCYSNPIEIDWDLPVLPRIGELVECEEIVGVEKMHDYNCEGLSWEVTWVVYRMCNGTVKPELHLTGG
jgi:hypothetical protein